jgi:hypothetical protein
MKYAGVLLNVVECQELAQTLGDTPYTVGSIHVLYKGLCNAYITGSVANPTAAIVQSHFCKNEPVGFGSNPDLLWDLLKMVDGWDCLLVKPEYSHRMAELVQIYTGRQVGFIDDLNFQLNYQVKQFSNPSVRLLTPRDLPLLVVTPVAVAGSGYHDAKEFLTKAISAAAIVDDHIVSIAYTAAQSKKYADIGVHTLEPFRKRGFARAAASLVAFRIQEEGKTPVWSTGHFNIPSLSIASQLGFTEISKRTYVATNLTQNWRFVQKLR